MRESSRSSRVVSRHTPENEALRRSRVDRKSTRLCFRSQRGHFSQVPADVERISADEREQQVFTRGLQAYTGERSLEALQGVARTAQEGPVLRPLGLHGVGVRRIEEPPQNAGDVLLVEVILGHIAA